METETWQKEHRRTGSLIFVDLLEVDTGVPRDCLPAAMDDRVGWRKRAVWGKGAGEGGGGGLSEVDPVVLGQ